MRKVFQSARQAVDDLMNDGATLMAGGFGLCGVPTAIIEAVKETGAKNLTVISNNAGVDGIGLGILLETRQIRKMISSYVGENKLFAQQYLSRAGNSNSIRRHAGGANSRGGAGIPAFYAKTGVGTVIAEGKEVREFGGEEYVMELELRADVSLIHVWKADTEGHLVYRKTARNFNPIMATAGGVTVVQVEHLVEPGELNPDEVHTPGIYVDRIIHVPNGKKQIEQRTMRKRADA
jgi:3-oxoacid CoA-transferase subunit A